MGQDESTFFQTETVTSILYRVAGQPSMNGNEIGLCRTCGVKGIGILFDSWVKDTFTNFGDLMPGSILCHACQFVFDEHSELLAQRVGKDKPQRMRNYSHFIVAGDWIPLSKSDKTKMGDILLNRSPDLAVVSVSGQKHIIFRARPGWWQIEEQTVRPFRDELKNLLAFAEELYQGELSKEEIETGRYVQYRIIRFGFERWREIENVLRPRRGSIALQLAVFLAQKEKGDDGQDDVVGPASNGGTTVDANLERCAGGL